jgi:hypothetical protein
VSAGNPCWALAELMAATTAVAIEAAVVDPSPRGDAGGGAGFGGRGGGAVVARGTGVVWDTEAAGVLAGRPSGRVVFAGPGGLTREEGARGDGGPIRDDPVTGAAAMGVAAVDVPGRALGCGLACSAHPATAAVVVPARTVAAIAATQYRIPAVDRRSRRCRPPARPFDDIGSQSWPR